MKNFQKFGLFYFMLSFCLLLQSINLQAVLSTKKQIPELSRDLNWLNTAPLSSEELLGKVVLIHFWSYANPNDLKEIPWLEGLKKKYKSKIVVLGIHSPLFTFENAKGNLSRAVDDLHLTYPVVQDRDDTLRRAFNVQDRPAFFLTDTALQVRWSSYDSLIKSQIEPVIDDLLKESGILAVDETLDPLDLTLSAGKSQILSLGFQHLSSLGNIEKVRVKKTQTFHLPETRLSGEVYLEGLWEFQEDFMSPKKPNARCVMVYHGEGLQIIAGAPSVNSLRLIVTLNGENVSKELLGTHLVVLKDGQSSLEIKDMKVYDLIKPKNLDEGEELVLQFEDPDMQIYGVSLGPINYIPPPKSEDGQAASQGQKAVIKSSLE